MEKSNDNWPSWKPFTEYILRYGDRRHAEGNPPAEDICDAEYWRERQRNEDLKQQPLDAA
jgi:hypothetical protein